VENQPATFSLVKGKKMKPRPPRFLVAGTLMVIGMLILSGCASSMMQPAAPQAAPEVSRALVTFLRPSYFGGAIQFGIWDSDQFVGILEPGSYIQVLVPPGEHIFLARAENWSYVHANLEAGRQYFILAKVFPGIWKARVAYDPIRKDDPQTDAEIADWLSSLKPIGVISNKVEAYTAPRLEQVRQAVSDFRNGGVESAALEAGDYRELN
jgi:hypothetical protein